MPFRTHTEYWNPNVSESVLDAAWDALDTNPMAIAISNDTARRAGLAPSMRFPWDGERSVYYVKGFHDLHCLKVLRKALVLQHNGENYASSFDHLLQCLDGLRQSVICTADDTPVPTTTPTHDAAGPFRLCRDWNKLVDWATRPDRHACHKFDDYRQATNELELFAHCPRDSPYFSVMHTYFEYHGHRDAYGVDSESKTEG
ncbi:hypothetical protein BDV95DRAFT_590119 [Massariosphaeria phaeospora]|uniref:Uncharacterized protein n=1 Tax=Massariosphaeria phaeospora TaxID=100035 RepID=A0A7C8MJ14_9PLEO|nr:hypothetical protein BDV95DRAFT_590119 [Massariosphaeria phaeospora]